MQVLEIIKGNVRKSTSSLGSKLNHTLILHSHVEAEEWVSSQATCSTSYITINHSSSSTYALHTIPVTCSNLRLWILYLCWIRSDSMKFTNFSAKDNQLKWYSLHSICLPLPFI